MAKTAMKIKQQRKQKFSTREYTRCNICGRPHSVLRKYGIDVYKRQAYILAPEGLKGGQKVMNGADAEVRVGNCLPLELIPVGTMVHNIELHPGKGGQMVRSAGNGLSLIHI